MRLAVYTDYPYRRAEGGVYAERAFVLFLGELATRMNRLLLVGRLQPGEGRGARSHYRVPDTIEFVPLPHYERLSEPGAAARAMRGSARAFACVLAEVDAVWLLGPHPLCLLFAAQAASRRRRVFLGVRQDLPRYVRTRHPGRRSLHLPADMLELSYRLLARGVPVIVVGPELARHYSSSKRLLELSVSLVRASDLPEAPPSRDWDGELTALSVGRLEPEKNPLLLADVLAKLCERDPRWRLVICGEGPLASPLDERLRQLRVADHARMAGYVPFGEGLAQLYRDSQALLHVSWTEGVPQVLFEAFAAGLPVVATAVGGVSEATGDAALLVPPGDADAAAAALARIAADPQLRERLAAAGLRRVRERTLEAECDRVAAFMAS